MIRLHFVVEGQTEEGFVNQLLRDHLANCGVFADARSVETSRDRHRIHRGGVLDFGRVRRDLERWMKEERHHAEAHFTTMLDLYALPDDFPGYAEARRSGNPYRRVRDLEGALKAELGHDRLIPYIQLHEFEALLSRTPHGSDIGSRSIATGSSVSSRSQPNSRVPSTSTTTRLPRSGSRRKSPTMLARRRRPDRSLLVTSGCPRCGPGARTSASGSRGSRRSARR